MAGAGGNLGRAEVARENADADGGSLTVRIVSEDGRVKEITVDVAPNESSQSVMQRVTQRVNADHDLIGAQSVFTLRGLGGDPPRDVDQVKIRSINAGFQIKSIYVDTAKSGLSDYGSGLDGAMNERRISLWDDGPALAGMVRVSSVIADGDEILSDRHLDFPNGTPASQMLTAMSQTLLAAGFANTFDGFGILLQDVPEDRTTLFSDSSPSDSLTNTAYESSVTASAVPGPASLALVTAGFLASGLRRR